MNISSQSRAATSFRCHAHKQLELGADSGVLGSAAITCKKPVNQCGFTLIELLVVIGVIVVMAAVMAPAMSFIKGGNDLGTAGNRISGLLEQSRAYAMSRNTYVWAGLKNVNPGGPVAIAAVYSKDGSANTNSTNLVTLGKLIVIENVCLASVTATNAGLNRQTADTNLSSGASLVSFSLTKGGSTYTFTNTIGFNSQGIAVTQGFDSISQIIEIGLIPSRNTNASPATMPSNVVVFQVSGITGSVKTYRP